MASFKEKTINEEDDGELSVEELRALAENLNFNLTSVLQNPRGSTTKTFYEEMRDFDPFRFTFDNPFKEDFENELDAGKLPPPPVPLPPVTLDMFHNYIDRNGSLLEKFGRNHPPKSITKKGSQKESSEFDQAQETTNDLKKKQNNNNNHEKNGAAAELNNRNSGESSKMARALEGGNVPTPRQVYAEVPALFQKAHFTLAEPAVFEQVSFVLFDFEANNHKNIIFRFLTQYPCSESAQQCLFFFSPSSKCNESSSLIILCV
jgi:hypothetical protein